MSAGQLQHHFPLLNSVIVGGMVDEFRKEGNVLFNDALNTVYLRRHTYGKGPLRN